MALTDDPVYRSLYLLREDALARGASEVARACSHSLVRLTAEEIAKQIGAMRAAAQSGEPHG